MISLLIAFVLTQNPVPTETLRPAFENTLVSTYPDGRTARLWLNANGTFTGQGRRGRPNAGVWTVKGAEVCLRQRRPVPVPLTFCTPIVAGGVGTTWTTKAVTGEQVRVTLVAGR